MSQVLPHTFFLHGIVVRIDLPEATGDIDGRLMVAVGDERAVIAVPQVVWSRDGMGITIGVRVRVEGVTDDGPLAAGATNIATRIQLAEGLVAEGRTH